jgi:hypothetical protein
MIATRTTRLTLAFILMVAAASSCAPDTPTPAPVKAKIFTFGTRRVEAIVPTGWEALDQGQVKRFRKGEFEIVLQYLGSPPAPPRNPAAPEAAPTIDELVDWGLLTIGAGVGHDERREVKFRRPVALDGRQAMDIETWNRLDHTNPQRIFLVNDGGDLLALQTVRMAFEDSLAAFDVIRDSLYFMSAR